MATKQAAPAPRSSVYRSELPAFLSALRTLRDKTQLNQTDFAKTLSRSQTYVSAAERGAVRLDGLQLRDWCQACGADLREWADLVETQLGVPEPPKRKTRGTGK
jgi:transcriptional regulator with XRE-family HTH domain